jgi:hypothetical protein
MAVTAGLIYRFELYLPPGSSGLLKVAVFDGGYTLYPSEPGEWFFGDNTLIGFDDRYYVKTEPHFLSIWSYNEDETYDHKFQIRIGQVSDELMIQSYLPGVSFETLGSKLEELIASQDNSREAQKARVRAELAALGVE